MKKLFIIYNTPYEECTIHEEIETGKLNLVKNNSVIASAKPERKTNYADISALKREVINIIGSEGNNVVSLME